MKFTLNNNTIKQLSSDCLIVAVDKNSVLTDSGKLIDKLLNGEISRVLSQGDLDTQSTNTLLFHTHHTHIKRILLVSYDHDKTTRRKNYYKLALAAANTLKKYRVNQADSLLHEIHLSNGNTNTKIQQEILAFNQAYYHFDQFKSKKPEWQKLETLSFVNNDQTHQDLEKIITETAAIANAINHAKDIANTPPNSCTPTFLARQANDLATASNQLSTEVLDEASMNQLGMHSLLSVSKGSDEQAKCIIMNYQGADKRQKPIVLVGKGITFDTGGLNLKAATGMALMKYDMCGAATVLALMKMVVELKLKINVVGCIASAENMVNGQASRPSDVVTSLSGKTIEIINTDAEGRLVLCDAMAYCQKFNPEIMIDIATLTGATIHALGYENNCLFSNDTALTEKLLQAGTAIGDPAWQLPLTDEGRQLLESDVADLKNAPNISSVVAKSTVAACFLSHFVDNCSWAHLDVANTAVCYDTNQASGRPIPMLANFLLNYK
ncbi:MAG: leucyl aminopeptidase [Pseudomonadota bacterium]